MYINMHSITISDKKNPTDLKKSGEGIWEGLKGDREEGNVVKILKVKISKYTI